MFAFIVALPFARNFLRTLPLCRRMIGRRVWPEPRQKTSMNWYACGCISVRWWNDLWLFDAASGWSRREAGSEITERTADRRPFSVWAFGREPQSMWINLKILGLPSSDAVRRGPRRLDQVDCSNPWKLNSAGRAVNLSDDSYLEGDGLMAACCDVICANVNATGATSGASIWTFQRVVWNWNWLLM